MDYRSLRQIWTSKVLSNKVNVQHDRKLSLSEILNLAAQTNAPIK
jgi:hypothetical protein